MYEELNCFEEALKHFGTRVDVIIAMEMSKRISPEESYQRIKDELKKLKSAVKSLTRVMNADSLKIHQNQDGSFSMEWDKEDPNWKWLNDLTSKEIQTIIEQAIKDQHDR